jgi:hypothetical protein
MSVDFQIVALLACVAMFSLCIYMTYRARLGINGLARGVMLLLILLVGFMVLMIVRRIDLLYNIVGDEVSFSSILVVLACVIAFVFTLDMYYVYRQRDVYAAWMAARKAKEDSLEELWNKNERTRKWDQQGYQIDP